MRRIEVAALAVALAFGLSVAVLAAEKPTGVTFGELTKIDGKSLTVTPKVKRGDPPVITVVVLCNDATKILRDTGAATMPAGAKFDDLKVGQQMTVHYSGPPDNKTALTVLFEPVNSAPNEK